MNKKILALPVLAVFIMMMVSPAMADVDGTSNDIAVSPIGELDVNAGQYKEITFTMFNKSSGKYMFQLREYDHDGIKIKYNNSDPVIDSNDFKTITANVSIDKYTHKGSYDCSIEISFLNMNDTQDTFKISVPVKVNVTALYSEDAYNKIFGIFTIPGIDSPELNGAITIILWLIITLVVIEIYNLIVWFVFKDEEDRDIAKNKISWIWFLIIMVYGVYNTLLVIGADKRIIDIYWMVMEFVYILFFALVAWNIYKALIHRFFTNMDKKNDEMGGIDSSLIPLFNIIGKVVISFVSAAVFLYGIGVNIAGIITGAGIIGLAVSLGAQNILTELFGGMSIILTRPFIKDDMVRIGDSQDVYEVVEVRLLNTEFKEWSNTTHIIIPNSIVSKSKITNCTMIHDAYRVFLYIGVGYNSDVDLVKKILLEVANAHPHTIKDGSYPAPDVRLESFDSSAINFRLAVYVDDFDDGTIFLGEMREAAIKKLNAEGVDIPFTRLEIYNK